MVIMGYVRLRTNWRSVLLVPYVMFPAQQHHAVYASIEEAAADD